jgi:hypothetical protein
VVGAPVARAALAVVAAAALGAAPLGGQALDDGVLAAPRRLYTTVEYGRERWDRYWEGERERSNDNIGTLGVGSVTWTGAYGVSERVSVIASLPYVWTRASRGPLQGMQGRQDVTVAAKVALLRRPVSGRAVLGATLLAGVGAPTSDYTPTSSRSRSGSAAAARSRAPRCASRTAAGGSPTARRATAGAPPSGSTGPPTTPTAASC